MTKSEILKWLKVQQEKAGGKVQEQKTAAYERLKAEKIEKSKLDELVAEIGPKLNEVYDRVLEWHKANIEYCGEVQPYSTSLTYSLSPYVNAADGMKDYLSRTEYRATKADDALGKKYAALAYDVRRTYDDVIRNVKTLPDAKQAAEYLRGLGFDLSELEAPPEKPMALARPINASLLLLHPDAEASA